MHSKKALVAARLSICPLIYMYFQFPVSAIEGRQLLLRWSRLVWNLSIVLSVYSAADALFCKLVLGQVSLEQGENNQKQYLDLPINRELLQHCASRRRGAEGKTGACRQSGRAAAALHFVAGSLFSLAQPRVAALPILGDTLHIKRSSARHPLRADAVSMGIDPYTQA